MTALPITSRLNRFSYKEFTIIEGINGPETLKLVDAIFKNKFQIAQIFKNDSHSYVSNVIINKKPFVMKIPRSRHIRRWQRYQTLFKDSESFRRFRTMLRIQELNLNTPKPVLAAEKRVNGMVVYDFLLYEYKEGTEANCQHVSMIIPELISLHHMGYLRRDAYPKNFLITDDKEVFFIDCRLKMPVLFRQIRCSLEMWKFIKYCRSSRRCLPHFITQSLPFQMAMKLEPLFSFVKKSRRNIRTQLKKLLPKTPMPIKIQENLEVFPDGKKKKTAPAFTDRREESYAVQQIRDGD